MRTARRLVLALGLLAPSLLLATAAEAAVVTGVTVSPSPAAPGELVTFRGPAVAGADELIGGCRNGTVTARNGAGQEYRITTAVAMLTSWSVSDSQFKLNGATEPGPLPVGTYVIGIHCFDDRGNQQAFETDLTFTVAEPNPAAYRGLTPARLLDTRPGQETVDGIDAGTGALGAGSIRFVKVLGRGGVPPSGVKAVTLNVTSTASTGPGFMTVYPTGESRPLTSNLNFVGGETVANLVVAKVGANGQVSFYNHSNTTHLIVDVAGWFPTTATFTPLTPARLLDTRPGQLTIDGQAAGEGPVAPASVRTLSVLGRGGVPASGVGAVILNVTAVNPTAAGFLTVFPAGEPRPVASNLNFTAGQVVPNLVVAKLGAGGQVSIFNDAGSTHLIADVAGWFPTSSSYHPLTPARLLDTRPGQDTVDGIDEGTGAVGPFATRVVKVTGRGNVPATGVGAVVINLTAVGPTRGGFVTVFPTGGDIPLASNLNFAPGQVVANQVIAKVGPEGHVSLYNDTGSTHLIVDVAGWFAR